MRSTHREILLTERSIRTIKAWQRKGGKNVAEFYKTKEISNMDRHCGSYS